MTTKTPVYQRIEPVAGRTWYFPVPKKFTAMDFVREFLLLRAWGRKHRLHVGFRLTDARLAEQTMIVSTRRRRRHSRVTCESLL